ncbi:Type I secretion system ATP-binding protein PrsD [compost metagenome]
MRQKVLIAAALLHDPGLVVLDEPNSGLDVASSLILRNVVAMLSARGKIIVASFGAYDESDLETYSPVVVHVDEDNQAVAVDSHPEVLLTPEAVA